VVNLMIISAVVIIEEVPLDKASIAVANEHTGPRRGVSPM